MDYKLKKSNEFFYDKLAKREVKKDYTYKKRITDMENKRMKNISSRKDYVDKRDEYCDQKYFQRKRLAEER